MRALLDPPVDELVVTEGCAARGAAVPTLRGWSRPGKRTTDQGRFLTLPITRHSQLRAQRRIFAGFPLNRPRRTLWSVGGTLIGAFAKLGARGVSNSACPDY